MNNLTLRKTHGLFLEDNDNIDMKGTYKITNVHPPIDIKDAVKKRIVIKTYYHLVIK